jgi:hypothetical protein
MAKAVFTELARVRYPCCIYISCYEDGCSALSWAYFRRVSGGHNTLRLTPRKRPGLMRLSVELSPLTKDILDTRRLQGSTGSTLVLSYSSKVAPLLQLDVRQRHRCDTAESGAKLTGPPNQSGVTANMPGCWHGVRSTNQRPHHVQQNDNKCNRSCGTTSQRAHTCTETSDRPQTLHRCLNETKTLTAQPPTATATMTARLEDSVSSHWMEEE